MGGLLTLGESLGLITTGPMRHATDGRIGFGGAESNVAIGVSRLDGEAHMIGRVGDDELGRRIIRELRAEGVRTHVSLDPDLPTALMLKEQPVPGRSRVIYYRDGNAGSRVSVDDVPEQLVADADIVHLTGITPGLSPSAAAATDRILTLANEHGVPVSFDVNHREGVWRDRDAAARYRDIAARSALLFAGDDEARLLTGKDLTEPGELLRALAEVTDGDVVLKLGADGAIAQIDGVGHVVPSIRISVVDTVGAGDAFVAGYLAELLAGASPAERLAMAVRCGAFTCLIAGDWEALPTRADLTLLDPDADPVSR